MGKQLFGILLLVFVIAVVFLGGLMLKSADTYTRDGTHDFKNGNPSNFALIVENEGNSFGELRFRVDINPNYACGWSCFACNSGAVSVCDQYCISNGLGRYRYPSEHTPCTNQCGRANTCSANVIEIDYNGQNVFYWENGVSTPVETNNLADIVNDVCGHHMDQYNEDVGAYNYRCTVTFTIKSNVNGGVMTVGARPSIMTYVAQAPDVDFGGFVTNIFDSIFGWLQEVLGW